MFFGFYEHSLDDKNRLMIPRKMREESGMKVFILKGFDGALSVYKAVTFEKMVQDIETLPFNLKNSRDYIRTALASACELDVDKQGRIMIPTLLINKFHIGKEVVVIGVGDHFEIWNKELYEKYESETSPNFEKIAEEIQVNKE